MSLLDQAREAPLMRDGIQVRSADELPPQNVVMPSVVRDALVELADAYAAYCNADGIAAEERALRDCDAALERLRR